MTDLVLIGIVAAATKAVALKRAAKLFEDFILHSPAFARDIYVVTLDKLKAGWQWTKR